MLEMNDNEILNINGGFLSFGAIASFVSGLMFVVGLIDGYTRPLKCRR